MKNFNKMKDCPCSKGEYCTNGLKCTEENCFLLKGSTFVICPSTASEKTRNEYAESV